MNEPMIGLLLLGTLAAFVIGFFWAPAWQAGILLALLAIFMRVEKDNEKTNKNLTVMMQNIAKLFEYLGRDRS